VQESNPQSGSEACDGVKVDVARLESSTLPCAVALRSADMRIANAVTMRKPALDAGIMRVWYWMVLG
jgi:hypothetical protein